MSGAAAAISNRIRTTMPRPCHAVHALCGPLQAPSRALLFPSEYQARKTEIASRIPPTTAISSPRSICLKFIAGQPNPPDRTLHPETVARFAPDMEFRQLLPEGRTVDELALLAT